MPSPASKNQNLDCHSLCALTTSPNKNNNCKRLRKNLEEKSQDCGICAQESLSGFSSQPSHAAVESCKKLKDPKLMQKSAADWISPGSVPIGLPVTAPILGDLTLACHRSGQLFRIFLGRELGSREPFRVRWAWVCPRLELWEVGTLNLGTFILEIITKKYFGAIFVLAPLF